MEITLTEEMLDRAIEDRARMYLCESCIVSQHPDVNMTGSVCVTTPDGVFEMTNEARSIVSMFTCGEYDEIRKQLPLTITLTED